MQTGLERRLCSVALHESLYASRPTEKAVNFGGASCERRPGAGWNQPVKKCLPVEEKPKTRWIKSAEGSSAPQARKIKAERTLEIQQFKTGRFGFWIVVFVGCTGPPRACGWYPHLNRSMGCLCACIPCWPGYSLQATYYGVLCRCTARLSCIVFFLDCEKVWFDCYGKIVDYIWPARVVFFCSLCWS